MAASTITRGTFVDGTTPWDSSNISALIYDRIDQMFGGVGGYATLELGGALKINGALTQLSNDGGALGTSSLGWSDLFLASGGVVNFSNGDVTLTHSTNTLTFGGAASGYIFNDGNVGIGVTPTSILHLRGSAPTLTLDDSGNTTTTISYRPQAAGYAERGAVSWNVTTGEMRISAGASGGSFFQTFYTNGTEGMRLDASGNLGLGVTPSASDIRHLQFGTNAVISGSGNAYLSNNAVYNGGWKYVASSVATMQYSMTSSGHQFDYAAAGTAGNAITFTTALGINTSGHLGIAATKRLYLDGTAGTGDTYLLQPSDNVMDFYVGGNHRGRIINEAIASYGTTGIGFYAANGGTNTGTTVVRNGGDGYLYLTTSSRRFKENISPAVVTDAQLDAFMATTPSWWDYTGQKNGALGFIAEDLASLPLDRYGFNPLVNYDGDGQVESNRDYALIAMHHLVIQRLERKIAALEARIH